MAFTLFEVADRDGIPIRLAQSTWNAHILVRHPEVEPYLNEIQAVISNPQLITLDNTGSHHLSRLGAVGGKWSSLYLDIVVKYNEAGDAGRIRTIFFNSRPPKGTIVWLTS